MSPSEMLALCEGADLQYMADEWTARLASAVRQLLADLDRARKLAAEACEIAASLDEANVSWGAGQVLRPASRERIAAIREELSK
jgi:hypothetical protein